MEPSTVTLIIGLAGIVSTLSVSGLGLYYTAKSRAPLRQALFSKQIEIVMEIANLQSREALIYSSAAVPCSRPT